MNRLAFPPLFSGRGVLLLLFGLASLAVAWRLGDDAFPIATVDFRVSRTNADEVLREKAEAIAGPLEGYKSVVQFGGEEDTGHYLELELGIPEMERLIARGLGVYYGSGCWCRATRWANTANT